MAMITLKEYAARHGRRLATFRQQAGRGRFKTAQKIGRDWFIDEDEQYEDLRIKDGKYINWRKKRKTESAE